MGNTCKVVENISSEYKNSEFQVNESISNYCQSEQQNHQLINQSPKKSILRISSQYQAYKPINTRRSLGLLSSFYEPIKVKKKVNFATDDYKDENVIDEYTKLYKLAPQKRRKKLQEPSILLPN